MTEGAVANLVQVSREAAEVGLIIVESHEGLADWDAIIRSLADAGYDYAASYMDVLDRLERQQPVYYVETDEQLNPQIAEIVREFEGGIVSLMDRVRHSGLRTVRFVAKHSPFVVVVSRHQLEQSAPGLFDHVGAIESFG